MPWSGQLRLNCRKARHAGCSHDSMATILKIIAFTMATAIGSTVCSAPPKTHLSDQKAPGHSQVVGTYSTAEFKNISINCQADDIASVTVFENRPKSCTGIVRIKSLSITYPTGFRQLFEYPNESEQDEGTTLTQASFQVLPGTKCLAKMTADLILKGEREKKCMSAPRIRLLVTRMRHVSMADEVPNWRAPLCRSQQFLKKWLRV